MRLRLSSTRQPYRRGGQVIGTRETPTIVGRVDLSATATLAILADPNITVAFNEGGGDDWKAPTAEERQLAVGELQSVIAAEQAEVDIASPPTGEAAAAIADALEAAKAEAKASREATLQALSERDAAVEDLAKARQELAIADADLVKLREELAAAQAKPADSKPEAAKPSSGKDQAPASKPDKA